MNSVQTPVLGKKSSPNSLPSKIDLKDKMNAALNDNLDYSSDSALSQDNSSMSNSPDSNSSFNKTFDDSLWEILKKRAFEDPAVLASLKTVLPELETEELLPSVPVKVFPKNPSVWIDKESVVCSNEDIIGPRWAIIWSEWIKPQMVDDKSFDSGFKMLLSVNHVNDVNAYPFDVLKGHLNQDMSKYSTDTLEDIAKAWSKMLFFIISGNRTRHPWFDTPVLNQFSAFAAAALPDVCSKYSELFLGWKEIESIKGANESDPDRAEELIKQNPKLAKIREKIHKNSEYMFKHSNFALLLGYYIAQHLDEMKLWWPKQLLTKINLKDVPEDEQSRIHDKQLRRRSKRSRAVTSGGNLGKDEVWFQRLPKMAKLPEEKKEFFENFFDGPNFLQHEEQWKTWLECQDN